MKRKPTLIGIVLVLLLSSLGYVYFFVYNKEHPDFEQLTPDFKLGAAELYNEFASNPEASGLKYNGKMIQVSGKPARVEIVDTLTIAVFVFGEGTFGDEGLRCTFLASSNAGLRDVTSLNGYEIKGFCSGYNETDVVLEKCSLVKP